MGFRFIHTADWQLGRSFAGFGSELSGRLQEARLRAITSIATVARERGIGHVVVAGDVWDHEMPSDQSLRRGLDRMAEASHVTWWLLPGNHDPAGPESLWTRLASMGVPGHIRPLAEAAPVEVAEGTFLLPAPWPSKRPGRDLTRALETMDTPPGARRIGIAHGPTRSIGDAADDAVVIDPARVRHAGLDYLALGDWHGAREAGPCCWYSGTPEPDRFRNNDQGFLLVVDLDAPESPERVKVATFEWRMAAIACDPETPVEGQLAPLFPAGRALDHVLLRLELAGTLRLGQRRELDTLLDRETPRLAYLRLRDGGLKVIAEEEDLDAVLGDGLLRDVVRRLSDPEGGEDAADAQAALRLLDALARG